MNHWGTEAYGMGLPMNPMNPMMHAGIMMENLNVPPMNPPPPVPLPLIGPAMPDIMQIEDDDLTNENQNQESQTNDVSSSQSTIRRSRDRGIPNNKRDNRDKEQGKNSAERRHRSRSRDRYDRLNRFNDRNDRSDRNRIDKSRIERKTKWDGSPNDKHLLPMPSMVPMAPIAPQGQGMAIGPIAPGQMNMGMMPGIMQYPGNGMMSSNIMMNNMIPPTNMEGQHMMMTNMGMMPNIMSNMMDQTMIVMNQPLMQPMPNQPIYMNSGVLLPPIPGTQIPQRRDRPKGCRTAFIGGLPPNISPDALNEIFQRFGSIHEIKSPKDGIYYVRFERPECVEGSFMVSGYRFKYHDQTDNDASTLYIDYALNRDDQAEYERVQRMRDPTPPRIEPFTPNNLAAISEKIKSETEFAEAAPTLVGWLERGECNKKFANQFYSLIQASNNQIRRLFSEKMQLDEEFQNLKISIRDKFAHVVMQFEQVAKILSAAKHQRVSDHFTKQQRRNIEMWLKMTEEVDNLKEEINAFFDEDEVDKTSKNTVPLEKYEELKKENENLTYELEGYKNEAYLAKDEAERKFEKFKAHFIAQEALQKKSVFPPLPQPNIEPPLPTSNLKPQPPPPTPDDDKVLLSGASVPPTEAKLISILTAFLMVHPLGASLDYLVSYVRSMNPNVTQATVLSTLQKYKDIFTCKTTGVGACIEHRWYFVTFDLIKSGK